MAKLLRQNTIKRSTSDYATNAFFIGKKSSSQKRPVIDYRGVNVKVKVPQFPLFRINKMIQEVAAHEVFITIDLTSAHEVFTTIDITNNI